MTNVKLKQLIQQLFSISVGLIKKGRGEALARHRTYTLRNQVGSDPELATFKSNVGSRWNKG